MAVDKLVDSAQLNSDLTDIADAIRAKTGKSASMQFPGEFVSEIGSIETGGGGGYSMDDIVEHNFTGSITYTGTDLKGGTFHASSITEFHAPNVTVMSGSQRGYTFQNCKSLTVIDFPNALTFANAQYLFGGCSSLESVYLPLANTIGPFAFQDCTSLKYLVLPRIKNTGINVISHSLATYQMNLLVFDCGDASRTGNDNVSFDSNTFNGETCQTIIVRQTMLAKITNSNANCLPTNFRSGGAGGTIYIPKALYDHLGDGTSLDYKAATNWSVFDAYGTITWAQIEGGQYENYYADGTPIPTT